MTATGEKKARDDQSLSPQSDPAAALRVPALRPVAPAPAAKRRPWLWAALGLAGLALAGIAYAQVWMARPTPVPVEVAAPVTRVLAINGRVAAVHTVNVTSVVTGPLVTLPVAEGDLVEAGQILAQVDSEAQNATVRQAMAALDAALVAQQQASENESPLRLC